MSPFFQRVVTKLHLIKDENGLGIHIAGGKGSKKGDLGIFVAEVTVGGAAHKYVCMFCNTACIYISNIMPSCISSSAFTKYYFLN